MSGDAGRLQADPLFLALTRPAMLLGVTYAWFMLEGMVCAMGCAKTIQDKLTEMNGVAECNVDFEAGKAHVAFDKTQLSENEIIALIEGMADGQYKVGPWEESNEEEVEEMEIEESDSGEESESTITEVSLPDFEIPNLFSLLFNQL